MSGATLYSTTLGLLVSVLVLGQYLHFLMVSELVKYFSTNSIVCAFKMNFQAPIL